MLLIVWLVMIENKGLQLNRQTDQHFFWYPRLWTLTGEVSWIVAAARLTLCHVIYHLFVMRSLFKPFFWHGYRCAVSLICCLEYLVCPVFNTALHSLTAMIMKWDSWCWLSKKVYCFIWINYCSTVCASLLLDSPAFIYLLFFLWLILLTFQLQ